ncbi:hypothetical protein GCM10023335_41620 [Streptomyces siamensis]|uniref:Uncharacterized protein n=2 Tax=Streptomyces siamensis TaxID=1274986 RepID=A0ABP9IZY4_9ACTN
MVLGIAAKPGIRVLAVGGAGALRGPADRELPVADNDAHVPAAHKAVAVVDEIGTPGRERHITVGHHDALPST